MTSGAEARDSSSGSIGAVGGVKVRSPLTTGIANFETVSLVSVRVVVLKPAKERLLINSGSSVRTSKLSSDVIELAGCASSTIAPWATRVTGIRSTSGLISLHGSQDGNTCPSIALFMAGSPQAPLSPKVS